MAILDYLQSHLVVAIDLLYSVPAELHWLSRVIVAYLDELP